MARLAPKPSSDVTITNYWACFRTTQLICSIFECKHWLWVNILSISQLLGLNLNVNGIHTCLLDMEIKLTCITCTVIYLQRHVVVQVKLHKYKNWNRLQTLQRYLTDGVGEWICKMIGKGAWRIFVTPLFSEIICINWFNSISCPYHQLIAHVHT